MITFERMFKTEKEQLMEKLEKIEIERTLE